MINLQHLFPKRNLQVCIFCLIIDWSKIAVVRTGTTGTWVQDFFFFFNFTSVDTELYCPKGKCGCQYFILLTLKKKLMDFFNKKQILDYYFCLKSGHVFLFQIFIIDNKLINKINLIYKTTDICSIFNADLSFSRNNFLFFSLNCRNITFV